MLCKLRDVSALRSKIRQLLSNALSDKGNTVSETAVKRNEKKKPDDYLKSWTLPTN